MNYAFCKYLIFSCCCKRNPRKRILGVQRQDLV